MKLKKLLRACSYCSNWVDSKESYEQAWDECERGDWMLWIAKRRDVDIRTLTKAKVECAKLVEHLMTDDRSVNALRVAERFSDGDATLEDLNDAADAADAAAYASAYAAAAAAAAYAVDAAAYAAVDAAAAAYADAYAATRSDVLKKSADICRKYIKFEDLRMGEL